MAANTEGLETQAKLQSLLLESHGFSDFMLELTILAASLLAWRGTIRCSMTVERGLPPASILSRGIQTMVLDESQFELDDGPCLRALRGQKAVFVPDLAASDTWSVYAHSIKSSGVAGIFSVPIITDAGVTATLNCYALDSTTMDNAFCRAATLLAESFSAILRLALRLHPAATVSGAGFTAERDSRAVVEAAVGLMMIQEQGSREAALGSLSRLATENGSRIREEAAGIVGESNGSHES